MSSDTKQIKIGTVTVREREFDVVMDPRYWSFHAKVGDVDITGANRDDLVAKISREISRQKVEHRIPLVIEHEGRYVRAVLRGKHDRTSQYLFTLASGEKIAEQYPKVIAQEEQVSDADIAEMNRLRAAKGEAEKALFDFIRSKVPYKSERAVWQLLQAGEKAALEAEAS